MTQTLTGVSETSGNAVNRHGQQLNDRKEAVTVIVASLVSLLYAKRDASICACVSKSTLFDNAY